MVEKHRNFVQAYLQCFDAAEAARRAQCGADALAAPAVRRELAAQRSRGVPAGRTPCAGWRRSPSDARTTASALCSRTTRPSASWT